VNKKDHFILYLYLGCILLSCVDISLNLDCLEIWHVGDMDNQQVFISSHNPIVNENGKLYKGPEEDGLVRIHQRNRINSVYASRKICFSNYLMIVEAGSLKSA
jgi:hypothetical protein